MPLKLIIGLVLIAHGIGHSLGYFPVFGWARAEGWSADSWLLTGPLGSTAANAIGVILWTVALVGFVAVGLGVLGIVVPAEWLRPLAVAAAVASLLAIGLYWDALPSIVSKIGAAAIDIAVLWAVLVGDWPSTDVVPR
jgi:hypothetical protein